MKTKMHDHIVSLMRKAYAAGYACGHDIGHDIGHDLGRFGEPAGPLGAEAAESFDIWMDEAECVPRIGPPRFQPIVVLLPLHIHSNANKREHWTKKAKRTRLEKGTTALYLSQIEKPALPVKVTLTRIAPRPLDTDNLASGFKATRDAVAEWLGADDKPGSGITWAYEQARPTTPKTYAAQILIEPGGE